MPDNSFDKLDQHYLAVRALTPGETTSSLASPSLAPPSLFDQILSPTTLIFISVLFLGAGVLIMTKIRKMQHLLMVLFTAFIATTIPFSVNLAIRPTELSSLAGPTSTPKNVIVSVVSDTTLSVTWETDNPGLGAVRLRETPGVSPLTRIITESGSGSVYRHYLEIPNLKSNTTYYLDILSDAIWYDNNGQPLSITTR